MLGTWDGDAVGGDVTRSREGMVPIAVYTVRITSLNRSTTYNTGWPSSEYPYVTDIGYENWADTLAPSRYPPSDTYSASTSEKSSPAYILTYPVASE